MAQKFPRTANKEDFNLVSDKTALAGQWNRIGELVVPAQQKICFGYGGIVNGVDTRGVLYIDLKDGTGNQLNGWIRLAVTDATEVKQVIILEERIERLRASATDRNQAYLLGETQVWAKEDSKLLILFKPDGNNDVTVSAANSTMYVPITVLVE